MPVEYVEQRNGGYYVQGTRVSLDSVVYAFLRGESSDGIAESFPALSLEQVYGAIAFYRSHRERTDRRRGVVVRGPRHGIEERPRLLPRAVDQRAERRRVAPLGGEAVDVLLHPLAEGLDVLDPGTDALCEFRLSGANPCKLTLERVEHRAGVHISEAPEHLDRCWLEPEDKRRRRQIGDQIGLAAPQPVSS